MPLPGSFPRSRVSKGSFCVRRGLHVKGMMSHIALALAVAPAAFAQSPGAFDASWVALAVDSAVREPRPPQPDYTREIEANKSYAIPAGEILAFQFLLNR